MRMKLAFRWYWALAAITATALLLIGALRLNRQEPQPSTLQAGPPIAPALLVAAAPGWVDVQGGTRRLGAKTDGIVAAVAAISGAPVRAGTVLLRLDEEGLQLDQQANALETQRQQYALKSLVDQSRHAKEEIARLQALVRIKAEPADVLRQAQAQMRSLDDALQAARLDVAAGELRQQALALRRKHLSLLAPSRGRVLRVDVHEGESVTEGTPVIWFAPEAPLIVRAELDERLFAQVKIGMSAEVEAEGGDGRVFRARLLSIASHVGPVRSLPEVRAATADDRVVECVFSLDEGGLLIGQRVIVRIRGTP